MQGMDREDGEEAGAGTGTGTQYGGGRTDYGLRTASEPPAIGESPINT